MKGKKVAEKKWWEFTRVMAQQIPAFDIPKDFAKSEVKLAKHVGADTFFMFVELDGQYIWPSKFGPMYRALGKRENNVKALQHKAVARLQRLLVVPTEEVPAELRKPASIRSSSP